MTQTSIILSIGSNKGDRLVNIRECIALIHRKVATVIKVSRLYQTPAWGFEGEAFYNAALLVHSHKSAERVLQEVLDIEKELGRTRSEATTYESREIDIDIIAYGNQVIKTENLEVPHPRMHQRHFVLQPLLDLQLDYIHPILKRTVVELIKECPDDNSYEVISSLESPIEEYRLEQFNNIVIEGNIGAGKTTLATKIAEDFNAKLLLEGFADNPFLPKFYEDKARYALPLEMSFLADRYQQLSDDLTQLDLFKKFIVSDYYIFKSLIFSRVTLQEDEYRLYHRIFEIMYKEIPKPDLYVYLYQNTAQLLANIKKRGRSYEQEIPSDYLDKINKGYLEYIKQQKELNIIVIDVSDKDFVENQEDYIAILETLTKC
ncbi:MAG TPA: 2-amino-4-hydroxy-6-hydroxymethyldihydropteridine diphosphokinase [Flavobacterium sp.]|nr:2-amino-4-hydroxy-6-hydroxymethyldihydropteridine diphosphokinase [Flavobacterium sp.]